MIRRVKELWRMRAGGRGARGRILKNSRRWDTRELPLVAENQTAEELQISWESTQGTTAVASTSGSSRAGDGAKVRC